MLSFLGFSMTLNQKACMKTGCGVVTSRMTFNIDEAQFIRVNGKSYIFDIWKTAE